MICGPSWFWEFSKGPKHVKEVFVLDTWGESTWKPLEACHDWDSVSERIHYKLTKLKQWPLEQLVPKGVTFPTEGWIRVVFLLA